MKVHTGATALLLAMCATAVDAQSLKEREYRATHEKYLADKMPGFNRKCDNNIDARLDWSTLLVDHVHSPSGYCGAVLEGIQRICESSRAGKDAVKEKIKSLTCGSGPQRMIGLKDGAIDYKINYSSSNDVDFVFEYLMNNL
jgi:hypothetical protein